MTKISQTGSAGENLTPTAMTKNTGEAEDTHNLTARDDGYLYRTRRGKIPFFKAGMRAAAGILL